MPHLHRRRFLRDATLAATAALALPRSSFAQSGEPSGVKPLEISIFSKHLQFLDYREMAKTVREIGFHGVDLTVRPGGHVEPSEVKEKLPQAISAIREEDLAHRMITTAVDDASDPIDQDVLTTAAEQGITHYRMNWFPYPDQIAMPEAIEAARKRIQDLSTLNKSLGLVGCYQNHAGTLIGASLWEVWMLLQGSAPEAFGIQYDIRHATVEGGTSWTNGFRLAQENIRTLVLKDFRWEKHDGKTVIVNTPIGEGMVDFPRYFALLKKHKIQVPVSLHLEYDIGGAQWGKRELTLPREKVYDAMAKDLSAIRKLWSEA